MKNKVGIHNNPFLEKIEPSFGQSFTFRKFDNASSANQRFWHFHPELELVYISNGSGKRHIGNHISYFKNGDLIFIGSNLPHFGFSDRFSEAKSEIVVQWKEDFLGQGVFDVPETLHIKKLFERSMQGIAFHGNTLTKVGQRLEDLSLMTPFERLISFIKILDQLARSEDYTILNTTTVGIVVNPKDSKRIDTIYKYVRRNFTETELPLADVAKLVSMTVPSFCRYFKKHTSKTFTQFVNEFRVVHATKLLAETDEPIANVCYDSGFNNFSHFNKHFKKITGKSPSQYRSELKEVIVNN